MSRDSISRQGSRYCLRGGKGKGGGPRSAFASPSLSSGSPSCHPFLKDGEPSSPSPRAFAGRSNTPKANVSGSLIGTHPAGAGRPGLRGVPGHRVAPPRRLPAAGQLASGAQHPSFTTTTPPPNSPVKHPRGQVTAPPLSGVRVRRDKGSPVLGGEKSIRGERWCGAIRAEIPPPTPAAGGREVREAQTPKLGGCSVSPRGSGLAHSAPRISTLGYPEPPVLARSNLSPARSFVVPKAALLTRAPGTAKPG